jgi:lipopolysaccharide/colanic/teichoic acid biosynthesis glycosyltransferase
MTPEPALNDFCFLTSVIRRIPRVTPQMSSQLTSSHQGTALSASAHPLPAAPAHGGMAPGDAGGIDAERLGEPVPTPPPLPLALKRVVDAALAALGLLVLSPLLAVIAVAIKLDSRGPVLYLSERVGRGGRRFQLYKFRTMHSHACRGERYGAAGAEQLFDELMADPTHRAEFQRLHKLRKDPRVTRLGALLRRSSLDELPQLANVLRGHLSLVGPRPVMAYEVDKLALIADGARKRITGVVVHPPGYWEFDWLRPGVTGYWQVTARSEVGFEERVRLDLLYTRNWSLRLDLRIALRTLGALAGRGAY